MKIAISVEGGPVQEFEYGGVAAAPAPVATGSRVLSANLQVVDTWPGAGFSIKHSEEYKAGEGFAIAIDVSDIESFTAAIEVGQDGPRGGSFKDVVISDAPGKMEGIVLGENQNTVSMAVGFNNPMAGINLTPGRHYLNVLFRNLGAAVVTKNTQS